MQRWKGEVITALAFSSALVAIGAYVSSQREATAQFHGRAVIHVEMREGQLTVEARDAPLSEVLRLVSERAAIKLTLRGEVNAVISQSFTGVSLEEAIRRLARGYSVGLVYDPSPGYPEDLRITEAWVIGTGEPGQTSVAQRRSLSPIRIEAPPQEQSSAESLEALGIPLWIEPNAPGRIMETTLQTIVALTREGGVQSASMLVDVLTQDKDPTMRGQAALALGQIKGIDLPLALEAAALQDDSPVVRTQAIQALAQAELRQAGPILAQALMVDPYPEARSMAAQALGRLPGEGALLALQKALASESNPSVRQTLNSALTSRDIQAKLTRVQSPAR